MKGTRWLLYLIVAVQDVAVGCRISDLGPADVRRFVYDIYSINTQFNARFSFIDTCTSLAL